MPDYKNGKIYKLTCGGLTYYGSTCQLTVAHRLAGHKSEFKKWLLGKGTNCTSFRLFEIGDPVIATLVEKVECSCKDELGRRERFYIETNECVNKNIPSRTTTEWREANADYFVEWRKANAGYFVEYYKNNKDAIVKNQAKHRKNNADKYAKYQAKFRESHPEYNTEYKKANADKIRDYKRKYYLKKKNMRAQCINGTATIEHNEIGEDSSS